MSMPFDPKSFLKTLPHSPGVYRMLGQHGVVLYVGKARDLKQRVSHYFQKNVDSHKTLTLVQQITHIEIIVTRTENEALLLENNLIKQLTPRYNVLLRDDKSYPYILLSEENNFPRLSIYRGPKRLKARYFGPYSDVKAARAVLNLLQKLFRIRNCTESFFKNRSRPCLQYQINRCTAPCVGYIARENYLQDMHHAILFLEGKDNKVITELASRMEQAAAHQDYEKAAVYRDKITQLRQVQQTQNVSKGHGNTDVVTVLREGQITCVEVLFIRGGKLIGNKALFPKVPEHTETQEILTEFLPQFYLNKVTQHDIPDEIVISETLPQQAWLTSALTEYAQRTTKIISNVRGIRARWLVLALDNAKQAIKQQTEGQNQWKARYKTLQEELGLAEIPQRIECFDISHSMGEATVGSCVVFDQGGPVKAKYRRFNIKNVTKGDDYAAMHQALLRHFQGLIKNNKSFPDLLIIDGGKGQLHEAERVLYTLQITDVILMAVAKGPSRKPGCEELHISGLSSPISLAPDSLGLHLIQQIRDEAHRFAITGHRHQRDKARVVSVLEQIPGVGPARRRVLLHYFGGLQELIDAHLEDLIKVPGINKPLAEKIFSYLHNPRFGS